MDWAATHPDIARLVGGQDHMEQILSAGGMKHRSCMLQHRIQMKSSAFSPNAAEIGLSSGSWHKARKGQPNLARPFVLCNPTQSIGSRFTLDFIASTSVSLQVL